MLAWLQKRTRTSDTEVDAAGQTDADINFTVKNNQPAVSLLLTQVASDSSVDGDVNNNFTGLEGSDCWSKHQMRYSHPIMRGLYGRTKDFVAKLTPRYPNASGTEVVNHLEWMFNLRFGADKAKQLVLFHERMKENRSHTSKQQR